MSQGGKGGLLPLPKVSPRTILFADPSRAAGYVDAGNFYGVAHAQAPAHHPPAVQGGNQPTRGQNVHREALGALPPLPGQAYIPQRDAHATASAGPGADPGPVAENGSRAGPSNEDLALLLQQNVEALTKATAQLSQLMLTVPKEISAAAAQAAAAGAKPPQEAASRAGVSTAAVAKEATTKEAAPPAVSKSGATQVTYAPAPPGSDEDPIEIYFRFNIIDGAPAPARSTSHQSAYQQEAEATSHLGLTALCVCVITLRSSPALLSHQRRHQQRRVRGEFVL